MKNLSFWQWVGLVIIITIIGGIIFRLIYGKQIIDATKEAYTKIPNPTPISSDSAYKGYYGTK